MYNSSTDIYGLHAVEGGKFIYSSTGTVPFDNVSFTLVSNAKWKASVSGTWYGTTTSTSPSTIEVIHKSANQEITLYFNVAFIPD